MRKVFWIINQYSSTPDIGIGGRHYYLAEELANQGHEVYLITSSYNHLQRLHPNIKSQYYVENIKPRFKVIWVKVPKYKEAHSKIRVLNWFLFSAKISKLIKLDILQPDIVYYSSPSPFGYFGAKFLSNYYKAPLIFEVRDIWPLTLIELGGVSPHHPFIRLMQWVEDRAYNKSDFVFSNLINAVEHMQSRGMSRDKFHWIPNGFSLREIEYQEPLSKDVLDLIPKNKFIIGYTGTLGLANATDDLIRALEYLKPNTDIHCVLVGNGKEKNTLVSMSKSLGLNNITFINAIPKKQVPSIIEYFDICFIGSQDKPIYRFGVAPNKVPEYLYSAKPIIFSYSGTGDPIQSVGAGLTIKASSPQSIADAVIHIYSLTENDRIQMGQCGRKAALERYEYSKLARKINKILFGND